MIRQPRFLPACLLTTWGSVPAGISFNSGSGDEPPVRFRDSFRGPTRYVPRKR